jgi:hypothetical protein
MSVSETPTVIAISRLFDLDIEVINIGDVDVGDGVEGMAVVMGAADDTDDADVDDADVDADTNRAKGQQRDEEARFTGQTYLFE